MRRALFTLVPLTLVLFGCPEKKPETNTTPSASVSTAMTAPSASASNMVSMSDAGGMMAAADAGSHHDEQNCPSAVSGATVTIKDVEGGVEVSVTGKDDGAAKEIRARMTKLADISKNLGEGPQQHTGTGGGHGKSGHCTVVLHNTKVDASEIPNGMKAKVTAKDPKEVDWLRRETRDRDRESKEPGGLEAGREHMLHCPAAVEGAKTAVKDAKDGVVVTVTGPADKVAEIRSRAKYLADIAKQPNPPKVEHTGTGMGGGSLGHCPIIVEGDTTVDLKDVDGGVEATVHTKKDVAALQKEAKTRAGNFDSSAAPATSASGKAK